MMDNAIRMDHTSKSSQFLFDKVELGVTFLQCTPTFLRLWSSENIRETIMSDRSSLKTLVLGGEMFPPLSEYSKWQNWESPLRKRIFNIYGITEVSCWSTIEEVNLQTEINSLGDPIDPDTLLEIRMNEDLVGELFIGSKTRLCIIDDEPISLLETSTPVFRPTGDIVSVDTSGKFIYEGRTNETVKKFGVKISLVRIEQIAMDIVGGLDGVKCVFVEGKIIIFYKSKEKVNFLSKLNEKLKENELPDDIIWIEQFPLSCHGKISKQKLIERYREIILHLPTTTLDVFFTNEIDKYFCSYETETVKRQKTNNIDWSFSN